MNFLTTFSTPVSIKKKEEKRPFKIYKIVLSYKKKKQEAKKTARINQHTYSQHRQTHSQSAKYKVNEDKI